MLETLPSQTSSSTRTATLAGATLREPPGGPAGLPQTAQSLRTIRRLVRDDQVCVLTFDRPGSSANIFDQRTLAELEQEIDFVAKASNLKGLVFTSAKNSIFIAGADLKSLSEVSLGEIRELIEQGQRV